MRNRRPRTTRPQELERHGHEHKGRKELEPEEAVVRPWMRLLTVGLALLLLGSMFRLCLKLGNLRSAVCAVALVIGAPGFLELASSFMIAVPTLSCVAAALAVLSGLGGRRRL